jgi:serine phosphatase RsbU (regulator of sigma subunit)
MNTLDAVTLVLAGLPDPALLLDTELRVIRHNRAFLSFTELGLKALNRALMKAAHAFEIVGSPETMDAARQCLASKHPVQLNETEIRFFGSETRTAIIAFIPIVDEEQNTIALVYLLRDVSSEARLQRRYQNLVKNLRDRLRTLEEKERIIAGDLEEARAFQQSLLSSLPDASSVRFASTYLPAEMVGGDFYDVTTLSPGHHRVLIADAAGHGIQAALRTMILKTEYERVTRMAPDPAKALEVLNTQLVTRYPTSPMHFSACCFDIQMVDGHALLRYSNAGAPPLLHAANGTVTEIHHAGPYAGVLAEATYSLTELPLHAGDRVYAMTDGLSETFTPEGERFGEERIHRILRAANALDESIRELVDAFNTFRATAAQGDDITIVAAAVV